MSYSKTDQLPISELLQPSDARDNNVKERAPEEWSQSVVLTDDGLHRIMAELAASVEKGVAPAPETHEQQSPPHNTDVDLNVPSIVFATPNTPNAGNAGNAAFEGQVSMMELTHSSSPQLFSAEHQHHMMNTMSQPGPGDVHQHNHHAMGIPHTLTVMRPFVCDVDNCRRSFDKQNILLRHKKSHAEDARHHVCPHCNKSFLQARNLKEHERVHSGEKPYVCDVPNCGREFNVSSNLVRHKRTHLSKEEARPFECRYPACGKKFTQSGHLQKHERLHTGERPFVCDFPGCTKSYPQQSPLTTHKRTHTNDRPYKCTVCEKTFYQAGDLRRHSNTHKRAAEIGQEIIRSRKDTHRRSVELNQQIASASQGMRETLQRLNQQPEKLAHHLQSLASNPGLVQALAEVHSLFPLVAPTATDGKAAGDKVQTPGQVQSPSSSSNHGQVPVLLTHVQTAATADKPALVGDVFSAVAKPLPPGFKPMSSAAPGLLSQQAQVSRSAALDAALAAAGSSPQMLHLQHNPQLDARVAHADQRHVHQEASAQHAGLEPVETALQQQHHHHPEPEPEPLQHHQL